MRDEDTKRRRMGKATVLFLRRRFWENLTSEGRERHKREQRKGWIPVTEKTGYCINF